jgi:dihydrofolate reductase
MSTRVRVACFAVSLDGYSAGPNQSLEKPFGEDAIALMNWAFPTRTFRQMFGQPDGETGVDDEFAARGFTNVGAWILGRNMFGPIRGPWPDDAWKGWWGDEPPYHTPVFVLTHHARAPIEMKGGTTFHFVTGGIEEALERAKHAAGEREVRVGGGVATVRSCLQARLLDALHLAYMPMYLGRGESLMSGIDFAALGYRVTESRTGEKALHVVLERAD